MSDTVPDEIEGFGQPSDQERIRERARLLRLSWAEAFGRSGENSRTAVRGIFGLAFEGTVFGVRG